MVSFGLLFTTLTPIFILLMIIAEILLIIFWIKMIIDVTRRDFVNNNDKVTWTLVIVIVGVIGTAIYYFTIKKGDKSGKQ